MAAHCGLAPGNGDVLPGRSGASDQFGQLQAAVTRAIDDLRRFLVDEPFALQPVAVPVVAVTYRVADHLAARGERPGVAPAPAEVAT